MTPQEIISVVLLLLFVLYICRCMSTGTYQTASGGLQKRPMPHVAYINSPYPPLEPADERQPISYLIA